MRWRDICVCVYLFTLVYEHKRERPKVIGACAFMHRVQLYDLVKYITLILHGACCGSFHVYIEMWVYVRVDFCAGLFVLLCVCVCVFVPQLRSGHVI